MKNDQRIFNNIGTSDFDLNKKTESLIALINTGIDLYNHYYCINPELKELGEEKRHLKKLLNNNLSVTDLKNITSQLKKIELTRHELEWHIDNADRLASDDVIHKLLYNTFPNISHDIKKLLVQYRQGLSYVLHTASTLTELAEELFPSLEIGVAILIKKIGRKSPLFSQIDSLQKKLQLEKSRIAAAMALRIEAAFHYQNLNQDDALVYVYHRLIQASVLNYESPLQTPHGSLTVELLSKFYAYIQDHGSHVTKARFDRMIHGDTSIPSDSIKIEDRIIGGKTYKIPFQLRDYIPIKKPTFWQGDKLRYDFFQKYSGLLVMLKMYSRWEEEHHPNSNVSLLLTMRGEIRQHQKQLDILYESTRGIRGLFLGKTKRFLSHWKDIIIQEEHQSWVRHYDSLKKQAEDYLLYPADSFIKRDVILDHVSIFMIEIEKFGPPFTQSFISSLKQLKIQLDHKPLEDEKLITVLEDQIKASENLLDSYSLPSYCIDDAVSLSSEELDRMEKKLDIDDEENVNDQDDDIGGTKKANIISWANGLFVPIQTQSMENTNHSSLDNTY